MWSARARVGPPPLSRWHAPGPPSRSTVPRARGRSPAAAPFPTRSFPPSTASTGARTRRLRSSPGGSCSRTPPDRASRSRAAGLRIFRRADFDAALASAAVAAGARLVANRVDVLELEPAGVQVVRRRRAASSSLPDRCRRSARAGAPVARAGAGRRERRPRRLAGRPGARSTGALLPRRRRRLLLGLPASRRRLGRHRLRPGPAVARRRSGRARALPRSPLRRRPRLRSIALAAIAIRFRSGAPPPPRAARRALRSRVLLVGDAAGVADPLTREGIRYALLSGKWAAECLIAGARRGVSPIASTPAWRRSSVERAARRAFSTTSRWRSGWCRSARRHSGIRSVLGDLLTGRQTYRGLRRTLLRAAVGRYALPSRQ